MSHSPILALQRAEKITGGEGIVIDGGAVTFDGVSVDKNLSIKNGSSLVQLKGATILGNVQVESGATISINGTTTVEGNLSAKKDLTLIGNAKISGNLTTTGDILLSQNATVTGAVTLASGKKISLNGTSSVKSIQTENGLASILHSLLLSSSIFNSSSCEIRSSSSRLAVSSGINCSEGTINFTACDFDGTVGISGGEVTLRDVSANDGITYTNGNLALAGSVAISSGKKLAIAQGKLIDVSKLANGAATIELENSLSHSTTFTTGATASTLASWFSCSGYEVYKKINSQDLIFIDDAQIKLTYDAGNGVTDANSIPNVDSAFTYNVAKTISPTSPTRTGYNFLGWADDSSATVAQYLVGSNLTLTSAKTIYAVWEPKKYTLTYSAGSGVTDAAGIPAADSSFQHNIAKAISSTTPTRPNCTFLGWADSNSSSATVQYQSGASITLTSAKTIYAVWEVNKITVTVHDSIIVYYPMANEFRADSCTFSKGVDDAYGSYKFYKPTFNNIKPSSGLVQSAYEPYATDSNGFKDTSQYQFEGWIISYDDDDDISDLQYELDGGRGFNDISRFITNPLSNNISSTTTAITIRAVFYCNE